MPLGRVVRVGTENNKSQITTKFLGVGVGGGLMETHTF